MGDGNGWVLDCSCGRPHWGRYGAAGLLVTHGPLVLLQHRAGWTHEGGTWAVPGGARDSHEDALSAATREAVEETSLDPATITQYDVWVDEHGEWSYTTILAHTCDAAAVTPTNGESDAVRWWAIGEVETLRLHHGFAAAWPALRDRIVDHRPGPRADQARTRLP